VKIPNGRTLIEKGDCAPSDTYHPKLFLLRGNNANAIICGSGNLSANGLLRGCECGSLIITRSSDKAPNKEFAQLVTWFDETWNSATKYASIETEYKKICKDRARRKRLVPTEDDVRPQVLAINRRRRGLTEEQIQQLRTYDNFWIDAGALGANLRRGYPG